MMNSGGSNVDGAASRSSGLHTIVRMGIDGLALISLVIALSVVYARDRSAPLKQEVPIPEPEESEVIPPPPPPPVSPLESLPPVDSEPRLAIRFSNSGEYGISTTSGNPDDPSDDHKRLTFSKDGGTNNTRLWVDGETPSLFMERVENSTQQFGDIEVTRDIRLVAGDVSRRTDTARVEYRIRNTGNANHVVGLRVMLDTFIGNNDGVPFVLSGADGIVSTISEFENQRVPDFISALEKPSLTDPGVIVNINLANPDLERPSKVILSHWPGTNATWEYPLTAFRGDSAVGLYYAQQALAPQAVRVVGFSYGLGTISSTRSKNASLSLSAGGPFHAGGQFWIVALVRDAQRNQEVRLVLPQGLVLADKQLEKQTPAAASGVSQLSWLVKAEATCIGNREIRVVLEPGNTQEVQTLVIEPPNAKLSIAANSSVVAGHSFWVTSLVQHPRAGQIAELILSDGLKLNEKETAKKEVAPSGKYTQISWLVKANRASKGEQTVKVSLSPDAITESARVVVQASNLVQ